MSRIQDIQFFFFLIKKEIDIQIFFLINKEIDIHIFFE